MLSFTASLKIYVAVEPCDMRKSFEGLAALTATSLREDVRYGALFVFSNHRRNRLKILYWDGTGLWVMASAWKRGRSRGLRARRKSFGCARKPSRCSPAGLICGERQCVHGVIAAIEHLPLKIQGKRLGSCFTVVE